MLPCWSNQFRLLDDVGIGGLNTYYNLKRIAQFPYARVNELPDFSRT